MKISIGKNLICLFISLVLLKSLTFCVLGDSAKCLVIVESSSLIECNEYFMF
jgi:uncharacterized MnhB-related membrane protein